MKQVYVLYRRTYVDFDVSKDIPQAASEHKATLNDKAVSLNARLTEREKHEEIYYHVSHDTIPLMV